MQTNLSIKKQKKIALAWTDVYLETNSLVNTQEMHALEQAIRTRKSSLAILDAHILSEAELVKATQIILSTFSMPQYTEKLVIALLKNRSVRYLSKILKISQRILFNKLNQTEFLVYTSHPLDEIRQEKIKQFIADKTTSSKPINAIFAIDQSLICGMKIIGKNQIFEQSIAKKVRELANILEQ